MLTARTTLGALMVLLASATAAAAPPRPITVDVDDLPPLPETGDDPGGVELAEVSAALSEEEVVVGAAKREQSLGNVASAVTVISGDRLRRFGYRTVAEALRAVAGLYINDDRMTERVGIRGMQLLGDFNTRILLLIDGAAVNEPWNQFVGTGYDLPVAIDEIARIEVIRGPVSSLYGTNAFFGIINVVTLGADQSPRAWARLGGGQFGAVTISAGFAQGGVDRQLRGTVVAHTRAGEQLVIPELGDQALDVDGVRGYQGGLVASWGGAFAQLRFYRRTRELTGAPYDSIVGDDRNQEHDSQVFVEGGVARDLTPSLSGTVRIYAERYWYRDELQEAALGEFRDLGDSAWLGAEVRARYAVLDHDRLGVTAGGEATYNDVLSQAYYVDAIDDGARVSTKFDIEGLYAEVDGAPAAWLAFTAGLRFDRSSTLEERVSPRAALFVDHDDRWGAKLLLADGFRNPSVIEAFFDDTSDFIANPELRAETIRSAELVAWGRPRPGLSVRLSGFWWRTDRLVEQEEVPFMDETRLQFQNVGALSSTGVEAEASYRDARGWMGFAGGTVAAVRDDDDVTALNAPAVTVSGGISSPLVRTLAHVSSELIVVGPRDTRVEGRRAATFVGWNLAIYAPDVHGVDVTVGVRNLLGRREEVPAQEDYDRDVGGPDEVIVPVLPGEGREVYARVGYRY